MYELPKILPIKKDSVESVVPVIRLPLSSRKKMISARKNKNRRRNRVDRRKSVRDGVFISFSFENDRRRGVDRRKV
ncbi:MAG: hypothetical protein U9P10_15245 [Thermodesulfobacteriota bacterium]|nr:hypothetical protein [Thermodesulfobacteriota bacterium]